MLSTAVKSSGVQWNPVESSGVHVDYVGDGKVLAIVIDDQYFTVPHLFLQESGHSSGIPVESTGILVESCRNPLIPVEFCWNSTGIRLEFSRNLAD